MQQIRVTLTPFTLRSGSVRISHYAVGLTSGLDHDELVVIHDVERDVHAIAVVRDIDFDIEDTSYRLEIKARISAIEADAWLAPVVPDRAAPLSVQDIAALLEVLRGDRIRFSEAVGELL